MRLPKDGYRITTLETKKLRLMWYTVISSGTTGTITLPTGGTIATNQWGTNVTAVASLYTNGYTPTGVAPQTSGGADITVTMSSNGVLALSGTPSAYPIAIIYCYDVDFFNYEPDYSINAITASSPNPSFTTITLSNTGLHILDTNATHDLIIVPGSDLTEDRQLTLTTGDAARTVTIEGNATISQDYSSDAAPTFGGLTKVGGASDYMAVATDGEITLYGNGRVTNSEWIDASGLKATGTKPATMIEHGTLETAAWSFSNEAIAGNQQSVSFKIRATRRMDRTVASTLTIKWSSTTTTGNGMWQLEYIWRKLNEDTTAAAEETLPVTTAVSATAEGMVESVFTGINLPADDDLIMFCRLTRLSANASDTAEDSLELHGIAFNWTTNKLGTPLG